MKKKVTSTVMLPMIARWCPSNVTKAMCWISESLFPKNCSQAANSISSFCPCIFTWKMNRRQYKIIYKSNTYETGSLFTKLRSTSKLKLFIFRTESQLFRVLNHRKFNIWLTNFDWTGEGKNTALTFFFFKELWA